jgi:hypothetical protein
MFRVRQAGIGGDVMGSESNDRYHSRSDKRVAISKIRVSTLMLGARPAEGLVEIEMP